LKPRVLSVIFIVEQSSDRPSGHQKAVQPVALKHMNVESEDDPQVKDLILSIQRFSYLAHRYPPSFDDKYHYGLLLQEMAAKLRYDLETKTRILPVDHIYELLELVCAWRYFCQNVLTVRRAINIKMHWNFVPVSMRLSITGEWR